MKQIAIFLLSIAIAYNSYCDYQCAKKTTESINNLSMRLHIDEKAILRQDTSILELIKLLESHVKTQTSINTEGWNIDKKQTQDFIEVLKLLNISRIH